MAEKSPEKFTFTNPPRIIRLYAKGYTTVYGSRPDGTYAQGDFRVFNGAEWDMEVTFTKKEDLNPNGLQVGDVVRWVGQSEYPDSGYRYKVKSIDGKYMTIVGMGSTTDRGASVDCEYDHEHPRYYVEADPPFIPGFYRHEKWTNRVDHYATQADFDRSWPRRLGERDKVKRVNITDVEE